MPIFAGGMLPVSCSVCMDRDFHQVLEYFVWQSTRFSLLYGYPGHHCLCSQRAPFLFGRSCVHCIYVPRDSHTCYCSTTLQLASNTLAAAGRFFIFILLLNQIPVFPAHWCYNLLISMWFSNHNAGSYSPHIRALASQLCST